MALTVEIARRDDDVRVYVRGQVDIDTESLLHSRLVEASLGGRRNMVVDLDGVDFIDSTGLSVLVVALTTARQHGTHLRLAITQERMLKLFRITGLSGVFDIRGDCAEAAEGDVGSDAAGQDSGHGGEPGRSGGGSEPIA